MRKRDDARTVYSSHQGRICPRCGKKQKSCRCGSEKVVVAGDGVVRVRREVKGRRGKPVTTISGVPLDPSGLKELAAELKRRCGGGGSVKEGVIEIQGDHREVVIPALQARGYTVKRAGG